MQPNQMTVALTGASGGIGQTLARELAKQGASLHLTGRDAKALTALVDELTGMAVAGQIISGTACDLLDDFQVDQWVESLQASDHQPNVLINNAGVSRFDLIENYSDHDMVVMMDLNSLVPMKLSRKLLPLFKQQPEARIVNVGSTFGAIGFPGYSVYSASKYAIKGFSEALARELSDTQIRVGCFLPRATKTAINLPNVVELNEKMNVAMDSPETVAKALIEFLCSDKSQQAIGWPEKLLVPINALFPSLVSRFIKAKLPLIKQYAA